MKTLPKWIILICIGIWMLVCLIDYWQYHQLQRLAIQQFQYGRLSAIVVVFSAAIGFLGYRFKEQLARYVHGLSILLLSMILLGLSVQAFMRINQGEALPSHQLVQFLGSNLLTVGAVTLLVISAYTAGDLLISCTRWRRIKSGHHLLRIGLGMILYTEILFVLGAFQLLHPVLVWVLVALFPAINYRKTLLFLKSLLWTPIRGFRKLNVVGIIAFCLLLWWINLNVVYINRPFPLGFDAMSLYVNLSSLINDYQGLVAGNSMYNWSLYASQGYLLFDEAAITLAISFGAGILGLMALFSFARRWVDANFAMVITAVFYAMPMVNWLSYKDVKVDMPLLFFLFLLLILFGEWLAYQPIVEEEDTMASAKKVKKKRKKKTSSFWKKLDRSYAWQKSVRQWVDRRFPNRPPDLSLLILIGILLGFSIGVKLTSILVLFMILTGISYRWGGLRAFWGMALFLLGASFVAGIDDQPGLRYFNTITVLLQWIFLAAGIGLLVWQAIQQRASLRKGILAYVVVGGVSLLMIAPWFLKNSTEIDRFSVNGLLNGKTNQPSLDIREIGRIYNDLENATEE